MRVLVTGGTGYLGSAIVHALARHGHEPLVFARHASSAALPGRAVDGDVRDRSALLRAAANADAVCHTAALVSVWRRRRADFDDVNIGGLETMIDVCRTLGTPRIVYTSSFLALPPADGARALHANDYQRTKAIARSVARTAATAGLPIVSLVPGVIYGPGRATDGNLVGRLIHDHLQGRLPGLIGADRRWSYAYIDDVAEAHVAALAHGELGAEYLLGGENVPQMRVFEIVRGLTGTALPRRLPFALAALLGSLEEARAWVSGSPPLLTRGVVEIFRHDWSLDSGRSVEKLSYRITPLMDGLRATLAGHFI
jgi:NAD+-dependent farnesol dehydrogenase